MKNLAIPRHITYKVMFKNYYLTISKYLLSLSIIFLFMFFSGCTNEGENTLPEPKGNAEKIVPKIPKPEYTEKDAGEWDLIKNDHVPIIKINSKSKKNNIEIRVNGNFSDQHYIERIGIMDENKQDLAGINLKKLQELNVTLTLDPIPDNPRIKVYVKCNLHDLWTKPIHPPEEK